MAVRGVVKQADLHIDFIPETNLATYKLVPTKRLHVPSRDPEQSIGIPKHYLCSNHSLRRPRLLNSTAPVNPGNSGVCNAALVQRGEGGGGPRFMVGLKRTLFVNQCNRKRD